MKCLDCGNEMAKGVVQSARKFFFTTTEHKNWITPYIGDDEAIVLSTHNWTSPTCIAYHCSYCKKVVISYSEQTE